ncbi:MAG: tetratricopeptide repeat protein [Flavobacteriaceae bacterium]
MGKIAYLFLLVLSLSATAQNQHLFEQGNALYNEGKYADAIDKYETILATKQQSAELYFNLANANYKLNNVAPSIYYYEKALQLSPNDTDISNNLAFAQNMTIDVIDAVPEGAITKLLKNITNILTFNGWAKLAVALVFCFVILFLIYYFSYSSVKKRLAFIASLTALGLMVLSVALAFHNYNLEKNDRPAIVFAQESKVNSEPNSRSEEVFRLHAGTKVQILDTVQHWKKIKLADGKSGWISSEDIKAL